MHTDAERKYAAILHQIWIKNGNKTVDKWNEQMYYICNES